MEEDYVREVLRKSRLTRRPRFSEVSTRSDSSTRSVRISKLFYGFPSPKKSVRYGTYAEDKVDISFLLQIILQSTAEELELIRGKSKDVKKKLYVYRSPEERFKPSSNYTLREEKPMKKHDAKMLEIQRMLKETIDKVLEFVCSVLKDTSEELQDKRSFIPIYIALDNIYKTESDDFTIINTKAEEMYKHLLHDIKRIERAQFSILEENKTLLHKYYAGQNADFFLNMIKKNYAIQWEKTRAYIKKYIDDKECQKLTDYINNHELKIQQDVEVTVQICTFLKISINELEEKRDEYPEKLDKECEMIQRINTTMQEELVNMKIERENLTESVALRKQQMADWIEYRDKKAIDDEIQRIKEEEEEEARILEEERIAAELAAEEEYIESLTIAEKKQYWLNKKKEAKKAAKLAKLAARKKRRKA